MHRHSRPVHCLCPNKAQPFNAPLGKRECKGSRTVICCIQVLATHYLLWPLKKLFRASVNTPSMSFSITITAGTVVGTSCSTDWITIPCATNTMNPDAQTGSTTGSVVSCVDRICGMVFNSFTNAATTPTSVYSEQLLSFCSSSTASVLRPHNRSLRVKSFQVLIFYTNSFLTVSVIKETKQKDVIFGVWSLIYFSVTGPQGLR